MAHKSILTREVLFSRGTATSLICPLCSCGTESIEHLLFECPICIQGWLKLDPSSTLFNYNLQDWHELIFRNCSSKNWFTSLHIPCNIIFSFMIWHIWLLRNSVVFENVQVRMVDTRKVLEKASEFYAIVGPMIRSTTPRVMNVSWMPPPQGWFKINTDGAAQGNPDRGGAGAVIRNHAGAWMVGSIRHLPCVNSTQAEFWALRDGLLLAKNLKLGKIIVELDASYIVDLLNDSSHNKENSSTLLMDCRILLEEFESTVVKHNFREVNRSADALAKLGCDFDKISRARIFSMLL